MVYFILSYLAGALTIFAPCILPVVPFVFARADQPFSRSSLPLLVGMGFAFAGVASLGAVAGSWAVEANTWGRAAAMVVLGLLGASLLFPSIAERLTRPLVTLGSRLSNRGQKRPAGEVASRTVASSFVLGVATGLLWAPCAGPVLGLVLTAAALQGPSAHTSLLLLAYAAGAATSLAVLLNIGRRLLTALTRSLGIGEGLRKGLGVAVLAGVAAVAFGWDTGALSAGSEAGGALEQQLLDRLRPATSAAQADDRSAIDGSGFLRVQSPSAPRLNLPSEGAMPALTGAVQWLNSPPLSAAELRGKVVLIDFWTFGCSNCRNALPHVREWNRKYKEEGLVVIGIHSPEFAYEKNIANVKTALGDLGIEFPVAIDNEFTVWRAFHNNYWPAHYFVDAKGQIRFHHFGEGEYDKSEQVIRQLLDEARRDAKPA